MQSNTVPQDFLDSIRKAQEAIETVGTKGVTREAVQEQLAGLSRLAQSVDFGEYDAPEWRASVVSALQEAERLFRVDSDGPGALRALDRAYDLALSPLPPPARDF